MNYNCACGSAEIRLTAEAQIMFRIGESGVEFECDTTELSPADFDALCMDCQRTDILQTNENIRRLLTDLLSDEVWAGLP